VRPAWQPGLPYTLPCCVFLLLQGRCFDATSQQACEARTSPAALQNNIDWKAYEAPINDVVCDL
jgi:hypothetical protein